MESKDIKKYVVGAAAIGLLLGGLYYLSGSEPLDPTIHTKERMLALLSEIKLERQVMLVKYLNIVLKGDPKKSDADFIKEQHQNYSAEKQKMLEQILARDSKVSEAQLNRWIS